MTRSALPLFDGFMKTPFERRFQGLLGQAWRARSWHVIVAEPGSGKTMGIGDLRDQAFSTGRDHRRTAIPRAGRDGPQNGTPKKQRWGTFC